jgi:integrase/recombinase XerD
MNLSEGIATYVAQKRASGLKYQSGESLFKSFLVRTGDIGLGEVTTRHILNHLDSRHSMTCTWRCKYNLLERFFDFWAVRGVIAPLILPPPRLADNSTYAPHIYSREQIRALLRAAFRLRQRYSQSTSAQTMRTLILFLYATGANIGESVALKTADVDVNKGTVMLRVNRHDRPRKIPICTDLSNAIRKYRQWKTRQGIASEYLFTKNDGEPLRRGSLNCLFRRVCFLATVQRMDGVSPTMQDFRPTFAVHRVTTWMRAGADLNRLLPALASYMGHANLSATQKYLSMTPERFRRQLNKLSPTRRKGYWRNDKSLMAFLSTLGPASRPIPTCANPVLRGLL